MGREDKWNWDTGSSIWHLWHAIYAWQVQMANTDTPNTEISALISSERNISLINNVGCSHLLPQHFPHVLRINLLTFCLSSTHMWVRSTFPVLHSHFTLVPFESSRWSPAGYITELLCSHGWEQWGGPIDRECKKEIWFPLSSLCSVLERQISSLWSHIYFHYSQSVYDLKCMCKKNMWPEHIWNY